MSRRPIIVKRARRLRKALARRPLPAHIDLVQWLKLRRHAQTTGEALAIIRAGRVKSESHTLGLDAKTQEVHTRIPASLRETLRVEGA